MFKRIAFFCLTVASIGVAHAARIDTFYGPLDVEEPILLELIEHPAVQRLKQVRQSGIAYYMVGPEEYSRYDHSIGVLAILRKNGATLKEQVAGLLHDVSHTAFSHVGDWIFNKANQENSYQDTIHDEFIKMSGIEEVLSKYGLTIEDVEPVEEKFPMLEQKLPDLCADRIEYNIQGAYHQHLIDYEQAMAIFKDLRFIDRKWVGNDPRLIATLVRCSLDMTEKFWGSAENYIASEFLAIAIRRALDVEIATYEDIHWGTDEDLWNRLMKAEDSTIKFFMEKIPRISSCFAFAEPSEADLIIRSKFRGVDPWVIGSEKRVRISEIDPVLASEYRMLQEKLRRGWSVRVGDTIRSAPDF